MGKFTSSQNPVTKEEPMRNKKLLAGLTVVLGMLFVLAAFVQPALAAERIVRFQNSACA